MLGSITSALGNMSIVMLDYRSKSICTFKSGLRKQTFETKSFPYCYWFIVHWKLHFNYKILCYDVTN